MPHSPLPGKGEADQGISKYEIPQSRGKFSLQIPTKHPGLTQRIGLSACKMKVAIVHTYSADYRAFHTELNTMW